MEKINKYNFKYPLFVINTGGNHIPLKRQYKIQKKIMQKQFPCSSIYESYDTKKIIFYRMKILRLIFRFLIIFYFVKLLSYLY
jgi:hypothetical protein